MAKVKIKPIGENILVRPNDEETKTSSGIVLPDTVNKEKPQKGEVIALGTCADPKFSVKVGDIVIFKKYSPDEIEIDGNKYLIMTEADVLGILN